MTKEYKKPLPRLYQEEAKIFYDGCKNKELLIQQCADCGKFRFPPQRMCPDCNSLNSKWTPVSGRGKICTFTIIPHFEPRAVPMATWPEDGYPILVIMVELPDAGNVHLISNMVNCKPEDIKVGMDVKVIFEQITDEFTLPKFEPA